MSTHLFPEVGDTFVHGWGTMRVRKFEVLRVLARTAPGHYPVGLGVEIREVAVAAGSPDAGRGKVDPKPVFIHVCPSDGTYRFERSEVSA